MRVQFRESDGWYSGLAMQMQMEGDQIVPSSGDLVIAEPDNFPLLVLGDSVNTSPNLPIDFVTVRWFHGEFNRQTGFVVPMFGHMTEDLGCPVFAGSAIRYMHHQKFDKAYGCETLNQALIEAGFKGPVLIYWYARGEELQVTKIVVGMIPEIVLPLFEGLQGKISEFLENPTAQEFRESKVISIIASRYPWPAEVECDTYDIGGLAPPVLKHFWTYNVETHRNAFFSKSTQVGLVSAWSTDSFSEANRRALRTLRALRIPLKQYRTDVDYRAIRKMEEIEKVLQVC